MYCVSKIICDNFNFVLQKKCRELSEATSVPEKSQQQRSSPVSVITAPTTVVKTEPISSE